MSTAALLGLVLAVMPQLALDGSAATQPGNGSLQELSNALINIWIIDIIAISVSVDHVALTLSIIPFLCIFPAALLISINDYQTFMRTLTLAILTLGFIVARYVANSI
jgi:hypothetical protein